MIYSFDDLRFTMIYFLADFLDDVFIDNTPEATTTQNRWDV